MLGAEGVKVKVIKQLAPTPSEFGQPLFSTKSPGFGPVNVTLLINSAALLELVTKRLRDTIPSS